MRDPPILLDLDGTLVDSLADIAESVNHVRDRFGLEPLGRAAVRGMVGDGVVRLLERALAAAAEPVPAAEAFAIYARHHLAQCTRLCRPYPGVHDWLGRWRERGTPLAVVTNKPSRFARAILDHLGLSPFLPVLIAGDTTPDRKPSPVPLNEALRRLGAPPGRGTMVGDGVQDLRAGKAAGLCTAAALYGFRDEALLRAEGADEYWIRFGEPVP